MRVLITGITGFVGSYMAEHALSQGAEVFGTSRGQSTAENIEHLRGRITLIQSDLRDDASVRSLVARSSPDYVVHLAAQSVVGVSWQAPAETLANNILSQVNLLEAIRPLAVPPRFLCVGSSEEYGMVYEEELPIRETNPLRPLSPYAVSKVTQDVMGYQYFKSYGLPIVRTRAFNHEGPRRGDVFVTSNFARQVAEIEAGLREPVVYVGDLTPRRDYSDVRDIVRGYWLLLERGEPGEVYNLCSGRSWSIQQVLEPPDRRFHGAGDRRRSRPERLRPSDVMISRATRRRSRRPRVEGDDSLRADLSEILDYWRERGPARRALIGSTPCESRWSTTGSPACGAASAASRSSASSFPRRTCSPCSTCRAPCRPSSSSASPPVHPAPARRGGRYRRYLPLFRRHPPLRPPRVRPRAVLSSHAVASRFPCLRARCTCCYCFTPMRCLDLYGEYFWPARLGDARGHAPSPLRSAVGIGAPRPASTALWPFSRFVADRIRRPTAGPPT